MTPREREALDFIKSHHREKGFPPSYDEIADHLGIKSKSGVHRLVVSLEEQGHIRRNNGDRAVKQRCIEIIHAPLETWVHIGEMASKLVESLKAENIDDATGEGTVTVDAKAFGELDVALTEASPERYSCDTCGWDLGGDTPCAAERPCVGMERGLWKPKTSVERSCDTCRFADAHSTKCRQKGSDASALNCGTSEKYDKWEPKTSGIRTNSCADCANYHEDENEDLEGCRMLKGQCIDNDKWAERIEQPNFTSNRDTDAKT